MWMQPFIELSCTSNCYFSILQYFLIGVIRVTGNRGKDLDTANISIKTNVLAKKSACFLLTTRLIHIIINIVSASWHPTSKQTLCIILKNTPNLGYCTCFLYKQLIPEVCSSIRIEHASDFKGGTELRGGRYLILSTWGNIDLDNFWNSIIQMTIQGSASIPAISLTLPLELLTLILSLSMLFALSCSSFHCCFYLQLAYFRLAEMGISKRNSVCLFWKHGCVRLVVLLQTEKSKI